MTAGDFEPVMRRAIAVAARHHPHPNPRVGAVLLDASGNVVGEYGHHRPGDPHAERGVIDAAGTIPEGAVLVVTLEPCDHTGRTPPCTVAILEAGIGTVVIGAVDPDERVAGRGIRRLVDAGVDVRTGVLADEVEASDPGYFHHRRTGMPLVTLKQATTLDGQTAAADGTSQWITGEDARRDAHRLRADHDGVLVGAGTARSDDPRLTVRLPGFQGPQPRPILVSGSRPLPAALRMLEGEAIVLAPEESSIVAHDVIRAGRGGVVDLSDAFARLPALGVLSVLVEGGAGIAASVWEADLADRGIVYLAGRIAGGTGQAAFDRVFATLSDSVEVEIGDVVRLGPDLRVPWRRV